MQVLFIGAGVAGLGAAWLLAKQGHEVVVLERDTPGAGASGAAGGMLTPTAEVKYGEDQALLQMELESLSRWPDFAAEIEAASGIDLDLRREGTLIVAVDRDDMEALDRVHDYHLQLDLHAERLSAEAAREREPALAPSVHGAVWCPTDIQVDPRRLVAGLVAACRAAGAEVREGVEVAEVLSEGGQATGVRTTEGEVVAADRVVVATGAWTRKLEGLGDDLPHIRPVRGQMIALQMGDPHLCTHVIRAPDAYIVPKSDGRLLIGSTMEEMGYDPRLTAGGVLDILYGAWEALPGVYDLPIVDMWTGFRPMTLDNLPVIRASKAIEGVWFSTGHGRNGILLTPHTAYRLAAELG